jgi:hypothetical protein
MFGGDGTPSVRLAGRLSSKAFSTVSSLSIDGVDGWAADAVEADGFDAGAAESQAAREVDPAVAARAMEHASSITGVDGFELGPAKPRPATLEPEATGQAPPAAEPEKEMLRVEVGGPSAVAVVPMLCRLSKIKRPGAALRQRRSAFPSSRV